jgi:hypothetical protein
MSADDLEFESRIADIANAANDVLGSNAVAEAAEEMRRTAEARTLQAGEELRLRLLRLSDVELNVAWSRLGSLLRLALGDEP